MGKILFETQRQWEHKHWDTLSQAVCRNNYLESPGPTVHGCIGNDVFVLTGVVRGHGRNPINTVCISTEDRGRLKGILKPAQSAHLGYWTLEERTLYSGFYIPVTWLDYAYTEEV